MPVVEQLKLASFKIEDLHVGLKRSFHVLVTEDMLDSFAALSGDVSPIHVNREASKIAGYPDRVAHGMLIASFYSTLVGVLLPGEKCLLLGSNIHFRNPVFPGDSLEVSGEISMIDPNLRYGQVKCRITKSDHTVASTATMKFQVRES